jgi:hypothetical protein
LARLVHHLEQIDAPRLGRNRHPAGVPQGSAKFSVDVKTFEDEPGSISVHGKLRRAISVYENFVLCLLALSQQL